MWTHKGRTHFASFASILSSLIGPWDPVLWCQCTPHQDLSLLVRHPYRPVWVSEDPAVLPDCLLLLWLKDGAHSTLCGLGLTGTQHNAWGLAWRCCRDGAGVPGGRGRGGRAGTLPGIVGAAHCIAWGVPDQPPAAVPKGTGTGHCRGGGSQTVWSHSSRPDIVW